MLHVDIPTMPEIRALVASRGDAHVSFYLPTTPETQHVEVARTQLGNMLREAEAQLEAVDTPKRTIWPITELVTDLIEDEDFWQFQATGLAVLVTPERLRSYRLPTHLTAITQVSDRFHIKPLLRSVGTPQHGFVLALAENEIRLVEVFAEMPPRILRVPDMPRDAASAVGTANVNSRSASGRIQGGEGQKVRLRQYLRQVDSALRPVLAGRSEPLILAATDPLLSLFRGINSYPGLTEAAIETSPVRLTPGELADAARPVMDDLHRQRIANVVQLFDTRAGQGRATSDIAQAARAATLGAVDTLLVDMDRVIPGTVDDTTGAVDFAQAASAASYGVVDEVAGRVLATGGEVLAVRADDLPGDAALAAVLRYPV